MGMKFTEQMTQALAIPISPGIAPANTSNSASPQTIGPIDMLKFKRIMAHIQLGVVTGTANVQAYFQGSNSSGSGFANMSGANTLTLNTSNSEGTLELRADQLPSGNRYVQLALLTNANAAFSAAQVFAGCPNYDPANQYDDTDLASTRLVM